MEHLLDHDLERYHLGMIHEEAELAPVEEHLLACGECAMRAAETAEYVNAVRAAIIFGGFDVGHGMTGQILSSPSLTVEKHLADCKG